MTEAELLHGNLIVGALLFAVGLVGFLSRRNMIVMFLAAEMMLQGVALSFIAWSRYHNNWDGQVLVTFILTVAACEAGIALALVTMLYHRSGKLDIAFWQNVREDNQPPYVDEEIPEITKEVPQWPKLTPSGVAPELPEQELAHRHNV